ncbi:PH domain-containing protein [Alphaproteobacteria bacterium]|nr:PH domain-containing protein [Alphaproteobacteria bacterium]
MFVSIYLEKWTAERVLTNRRLILKRSFIRQKTEEISFNRVEEVNLSQSILQRILGSGDIKVTGTGAGEIMLKNIDDPLNAQKKVNELRNWE